VQSSSYLEALSTLVKDRLKESRKKRRKTLGKQTQRNLKLLMPYLTKSFKRRGVLRERG
jgi:predicted transcriptional regulator